MEILHQQLNQFSAYELTPDQLKEGLEFTTTQRAVLQNLLSMTANRAVNLRLDPANVMGYAQEQAGLAGELLILNYLLSPED